MVAAAALVAAGGGGAALAGGTDDDGRSREREVIDAAAKRLDVAPEALRGALGAAEDAQLDQAVREGELARKQADAFKRARRRSGRVLGPPGGPHGFGPPGRGMSPGPGMLPGRGGPHGRGDPLATVAKALGLSERRLFTRLRAGKTIEEIAKAQGKTLE